ncbi:hypothetical protein TKK_0011088 [Trichogramma kaykai]
MSDEPKQDDFSRVNIRQLKSENQWETWKNPCMGLNNLHAVGMTGLTSSWRTTTSKDQQQTSEYIFVKVNQKN